jgi:hypothetical protein
VEQGREAERLMSSKPRKQQHPSSKQSGGEWLHPGLLHTWGIRGVYEGYTRGLLGVSAQVRYCRLSAGEQEVAFGLGLGRGGW